MSEEVPVKKYTYGEYTIIGPSAHVCVFSGQAEITIYVYYAYSYTRSHTIVGINTDKMFYHILKALDRELKKAKGEDD